MRKAKRKRLSGITILGLILGLIFILSAPAITQTTTKLYIEPKLVGAKAINDTFSVDVKVADVTDLYAFQFDVIFDPTILQVQSVVEGSFLKSDGAATSFEGGNTSTPGLIDNVKGFRMSVEYGVNGSGTLATITFKVIAIGVSPIDLTGDKLANSIPQYIVYFTEDGAFDNQPPATPTISAPSLTNNTSVGVSGSAEANSTIKVYEGLTLKATTNANASGTWNTTIALAEGTHTLTATATDAAGNTSPSSAPASVTVDLTPPAAPTINPVTTPTNVTPQTITGAKTTDSATIWVNGSTTGVTYPTATTWSYIMNLSEGVNAISVTAKDLAGNESNPATTSITLDTVVPAAPTILAPSLTNNTSVGVSGSAEANSTVKVYEGLSLKATTNANASGAWNTTIFLAEGPHTLTTTATDAAGNTSPSSAPASVTVDLTPPAAPAINPVTTPTNVTSQTISGTKTADSATIWVNGSTTGVTYPTDTTWSYIMNLSEGVNAISVTAKDLAGNQSNPATTSITLDTVVPAAPTISAPSLTNNTSVGVSGSAEANSTVKVYEGLSLKATTNANASGAWNTTIFLAEGPHTLTTTATDAAGNTSPSSAPASVTVDLTPPAAPTINPVTTPTNVTPQTITGTKTADSATIWANGSTADVTYPTATTWSYIVNLSEGVNAISVTAKDLAGNESNPATTSITLDTVVPAAVGDLRMSSRTTTSITLTWTAPGDDGNAGTAFQYDIRYSTSPITEANWGAATQAVGEPAPQPASSPETFTVISLSPGQGYYFALKTRDEVNNWSTLSNVLNKGTLYRGDANKDGIVDVLDLVIVGKAFDTTPLSPNWDARADLNKDNVVDVLDLVILGKDFDKQSV